MTSGNMELKLNSEAAAAVASAAIMQSLTEEYKEQVLSQAVQYLLSPPKGNTPSFRDGKTPLQEAFEQALTVAAHKAVADRIANDPQLNRAINDLLSPLITAALDEEAKNWDTTLASKLGQAIGDYLAQCARERRDRGWE